MNGWRTLLPAMLLIVLLPVCFLTLTACGSGDDDEVLTPPQAGDDDETGDDFHHEVFTQEIPSGLEDTATGDFYDPAVEYAPIVIDPAYTHVLNFEITPMMPPWRKAIKSTGPLIVYTDDLDVIVFSPMEHFFVSLVWLEDGAIHYGIEGDVERIPAGFTHRFLLVQGRGINATIQRWGDLMLADRGRDERVDPYADPGLSFLGYWTDNGAAYYYNTERGMNEAETLLAVKADADARGIPYRYMQLDSWWYFKEPGFNPGGLILWEPQPEMFPDGLESFQRQLGLPLMFHNRWFALDNGYLESYPFVFEEDMAFPIGRGVYDHFMERVLAWGGFTYEQDWLARQFWGARYLRNGVGHGEQWMKDMHDAAVDHGLTMQICMTAAAHLLSAVDLPGITTVRTSIDYRKDLSKESYWPQFHTVNLVAWALGVWPFKDNFQSWERYGEAEALISALSGGMVGPSDRIGSALPEILGATCRHDGLLLKPDRPATPVDAMFLDHERPYTVATWSEREGLGRWTYLAAFHLAKEHPDRHAGHRLWAMASYFDFEGSDVDGMFVFPDHVTDWRVDLTKDLGIEGPVVAYDWRTATARVAMGTLDLPPFPDLYDHAYVVLAPILSNGMALVGEANKFVTLAAARFSSIEVLPGAIRVTVAGVPGEEVTLLGYDTLPGRMIGATAVIESSGETTITLSR